MQLRRLPLILVALYLLLSLAPQPEALSVRSVCRMTGLPMGAEPLAVSQPIRSCCARAIRAATSAYPLAAIHTSSCCVIRASSGPPFVARVAEYSLADTFAVLPRPIAALVFVDATADIRHADIDHRAPRGPPRFASSPRAPPFFS